MNKLLAAGMVFWVSFSGMIHPRARFYDSAPVSIPTPPAASTAPVAATPTQSAAASQAAAVVPELSNPSSYFVTFMPSETFAPIGRIKDLERVYNTMKKQIRKALTDVLATLPDVEGKKQEVLFTGSNNPLNYVKGYEDLCSDAAKAVEKRDAVRKAYAAAKAKLSSEKPDLFKEVIKYESVPGQNASFESALKKADLYDEWKEMKSTEAKAAAAEAACDAALRAFSADGTSLVKAYSEKCKAVDKAYQKRDAALRAT